MFTPASIKSSGSRAPAHAMSAPAKVWIRNPKADDEDVYLLGSVVGEADGTDVTVKMDKGGNATVDREQVFTANPDGFAPVKRSRPAKSREELDASREERFYRKEQRRRYRRDLHSNLKQAAQTYTDFSGRKHQATKQIMPMAARRHVEVGTDSTDDEWMSMFVLTLS